MLPEQGEEFFRNISAVAEELTEKSPREARSRLTIIYVPRRDHHGEQVATITDHQVNFEAVEPARASLATLGQLPEDLFDLIRRLWQTLMGVESMKEMPVQDPKRVCRKAASGKTISLCNSTNR